MSIVALVMTDGRSGYLSTAIDSMHYLSGDVTRRVLHDDTGDHDHRRDLTKEYPDWEVIGTPTRAGFGGAYRHAYQWLANYTTQPYIFSTEDDFEYIRDVDLDAMVQVLDTHRHLTQLALRRQPWNHDERAAGGIVEQRPRAYLDCRDYRGHHWLEHNLFHTTNPSLIRRSLIVDHEWPTVPHSEGVFSAGLFADRSARAAFWGQRDSGEWCRHIGDVRSGRGY